MTDVSKVGGSSMPEQPQNHALQDMTGLIQQLQEQVGKCAKAVQELKDKLMHDIMSRIEQTLGKIEKLQKTYPGLFNTPEMKQMVNQTQSLIDHGADASPHDIEKLATQISVVAAQLSNT